MIYFVGGWVGGWMGRWVGGRWVGDFLTPPIVFIFECVSKHTSLILNMALKFVYGYYIKSYN